MNTLKLTLKLNTADTPEVVCDIRSTPWKIGINNFLHAEIDTRILGRRKPPFPQKKDEKKILHNTKKNPPPRQVNYRSKFRKNACECECATLNKLGFV